LYSSLRQIDISGSAFAEIPLKVLIHEYDSYNELVIDTPRIVIMKAFEKCVNIECFKFVSNSLTSVPEGLKQFTTLKTLKLDGNPIENFSVIVELTRFV